MDTKIIKFYSSRKEHGYMSNFARYEVMMNGKIYATSEHYYQSQKFAGTPYEEQIRLANGPMAAATMGRDRSLPLRSDWELVKNDIMRAVVEAKFRQYDDLRKQLLATGSAILIEDTSTSGDDYWGQVNGQGKNMLGLILMEVRKKLQQELLLPIINDPVDNSFNKEDKIDIINKVIELFVNDDVWTSYHYAVNSESKPVNSWDVTACRWCTLGAIEKFAAQKNINQFEIFGISHEVNIFSESRFGKTLAEINDHLGREEALKVLIEYRNVLQRQQ